jgi:hypothetical protein
MFIAEQSSNLKQQEKACCEGKAGPGKKALAFLFLFEEINAIKRQLKPEKTVSSNYKKAESILSNDINQSNKSLEVMKVRSTCLLLLNPLALEKPS